MQELSWDPLEFEKSIETFIKRFSEEMDIRIDTDFDLDNKLINDRSQAVVFRLIQESLNNIIKHASATEIKVSLSIIEDETSLQAQIQDNGVGFLVEKGESQGLGLSQMRSRVKSIGGSLFIDGNKKEKGSTVRARFPLG